MMGDPENPTCLDCDYSLKHLETSFCPECGRAFNSNDPRTFGPVKKGPLFKNWVIVLAVALVIGPMILVFFTDLPFEPLAYVGVALLLILEWTAWFSPALFAMVFHEWVDRAEVKKHLMISTILVLLLLALLLL